MGLGARLFALKDEKTRAWLDGQRGLMNKIKSEIKPGTRYVWFHFASLGEFEQGRSVIEELKVKQKHQPVIITFFSPSGYLVRRDYPLADHVFYLPTDTANNARELVKLFNPRIAIFTKYEYWYHYFKELYAANVPLYVISAIFRENQVFFKIYGRLHRQMLGYVTHFFVQNRQSKQLLNSLGITAVSVSGDTRFDRVAQTAHSPRSFKAIKVFCDDSVVVVAGSTWPDDEKLLEAAIGKHRQWKWIIAPHEISQEHIASLVHLLRNYSVVRYSAIENTPEASAKYSVMIIDNMGMLSSLYQYGKIAYIGGGFGSGIHNTLEAAAFGVPIVFGPNYEKFQEAKDMIALGAGFSIRGVKELEVLLDKFKKLAYLKNSGEIAAQYVESRTGATDLILAHVLNCSFGSE